MSKRHYREVDGHLFPGPELDGWNGKGVEPLFSHVFGGCVSWRSPTTGKFYVVSLEAGEPIEVEANE